MNTLPSPQPAPVLRVEDLHVTFTLEHGSVVAVDNISFELLPGQILGIVGESGSGKSVTSKALMRMLRHPGRVDSGNIKLHGRDLLALSAKEMLEVRGKEIAMIFQDPQAALNPVMRIKDQIIEAMKIHGVDRESARVRAIELLEKVGIPEPAVAAEKYPHQFSGGMRQRVVIAIALANEPSVLIADEPTTALDVTIQAQILDLLRRLRDELGIAILFITHDMGVVAELCDDVVVMHQGHIVERGTVRQVLSNPVDDYTIGLMAAIPKTDSPLRDDAPEANSLPTLAVKELRTNVNLQRRGLFRRTTPHFAVDGVSLHILPGETLALVGESGCGKSTLSRTIVGINEVTSGEIEVDGVSVSTMSAGQKKSMVQSIQYVFQDPYSSLNPRRTAGQSLEEALTVAGVDRHDVRDRSVELLNRVSLGPEYLDRYPWAFSGGQRQRIGIARALASDPKLLILDEPVSALDVSIQAQILELLRELQEQYTLSYLFISHDLTVVRDISHRVAVMKKGQIVETGTTQQVYNAPQHPYTRALLDATPRLDATFT